MGITASVTNNQITASVGETQIDVSVSGGVGPTGSSGTVAVSAPITNAGTTTAANIGLSVGTGLAVSGGSLVVSYGTTAGTACEGNDARLSDSREWSASTATQAEAEAGTSTTRRAFTPQRVFQAIAAWWAGSAAKTKLDGIATGATANQTDAYLLSRANHTGTQLAATISDFTTAVIAAAPPTTNASLLTSGTLPDARLSSSIARTSDVSSAVAALVASAPATLDTLNELAAALGNDASFSTTVTNALAAKAPIASPTFTGTVSGITKAMVGLGNVDNTSDANKPVSTATQTALDAKAASSHTHGNFTSDGRLADTDWWGGNFPVIIGDTGELSGGFIDAAYVNNVANAIHTHGNITNAGAIGTTSGQIVVTTSGGALTTAATISSAQVSGLGTLATQSGTFSGTSSGTNTGDQTITLNGDVTGSGTGTFAATIANGAITDAKITSAGLSASSINWVAIAAWQPNTAYNKGDLVSYLGVGYRRSQSGTSGSVFNISNWQQVTPTLYAVQSDFVSSTSYIGRAVSGSATSASVWTIRKTILSSAGSVSSTTTATNVAWDNRLTATYS